MEAKRTTGKAYRYLVMMILPLLGVFPSVLFANFSSTASSVEEKWLNDQSFSKPFAFCASAKQPLSARHFQKTRPRGLPVPGPDNKDFMPTEMPLLDHFTADSILFPELYYPVDFIPCAFFSIRAPPA